MTNNDDLALKLIAAAEVIATEHYTDDQWFHYLCLAHHSNILALLAERTADKAENASLRQRVAELEKYAADRDAENQGLMLTVGRLRTEREARTVSVKLPDCDYGAVQHMSGGSDDYCRGFVDGTQNAIKRVKSDFAAAGIKLEVEE